MSLPATTYALALGKVACDYCVEGVVTKDGGPPICPSCWEGLYEEGRLTEFKEDGVLRVFLDGKELDL